MKKLVLAAAVAVFGIAGVNAQATGVEAGVHIGIPVGDIADYSSFNVGLDVAYLHPISSNFKLGVASGYSHFIGKDYDFSAGGVTYTIEGEDFGIVPVAATAKFFPTQNFFIGADLGYAFVTEEGADGGFYYQPKVGYSGALVDVFASYKGISQDGGTISTVGAGVAYKF